MPAKQKERRGSAFETTDPQILRTRAAIVASTRKLLIDNGYRAITVEKISADSGASRSTIYRHWPNIEDLLFDAFASLTGKPFESPDTGDFRTDLRDITGQFIEAASSSKWLNLLPSFIEASHHDEHCAELLADLVQYSRSTTIQILKKAKKDGELSPKANVEWMADVIIGPLIYRGLLSKQPLDEKGLLEYLVDCATAG
ncbi:TetR/AcrR family transcriptional regulator [Parahaliea mediterranea]|uniref:TetR/AcrR family transcriptional regulator n=1 Tax=Parahaliea mediterranea TaxID=651086 RepID=A0A939IMX6_9GAMM|nr:TetR/AcrR family transcriptional regulator [Parahaliea mediterranea]MBN7797493.1 TetR/AcrR family transcriptional regulator [Parahaliea mediterranea]